ncbi:hypothetical protein GCM10027562_42090 [Arthrobacter pigmenti]
MQELAKRLEAKNVAATIHVVGGAAMSLEYDNRRFTDDVDAKFAPEQSVRDAAGEMAADLGLSPNWLNNAASAYIPDGEDPEAKSVRIADNLQLTLASPRYLLAMKLAAGRDRDIEDIAVLCRALGITTAGEAADIGFALYGEDSIQLSERDDVMLIAGEALSMRIEDENHQ